MSHQNGERSRSQRAAAPSACATARPLASGRRTTRPDTTKPGSGQRPSLATPGSTARAGRASSASLPGVRGSMLLPQAQLPRGWTPRKAFEAARINLKRGALSEASAFAQQACDGEPECLQFRALHAWLRVQRGELQGEADAAEVLAILTRALREQRHDLEIRLYRARVLSRLGRMEEAIRDFSVVASMDPRNLEAVREVRLYQARTQRQSSLSGVLSKVFTRDDEP